MYLKIALVLYFTTLIAALSLAILFKFSKSGPFRNQFMYFFTAMAWALTTRFLDQTEILHVDLLIVITPLCLTSIWLVRSITNYRE